MVRRQGRNILQHVGELGKGRGINIPHNIGECGEGRGINIPHNKGGVWYGDRGINITHL
jgi:hypothetical protein